MGNYRYTVTNSWVPELQYESGPIEVNSIVEPVQDVVNKYAFQYKYDSRRRMSHKKVPGADWVYMVYDDRDRLVMTQDGNQRGKQVPEWTFTKYDVLNRPVLTGIYTDSENRDQPGMQQQINEFYAAAESNEDEWFEVVGETVLGYSNQSFPKVSLADSYLTVTYYDDYSFKTLIGADAPDYEYDNTRLVASGGDTGQESAEFNRVQGQVTGSRIKNLETGEWLWNVNYFDDRYRTIQMITQNNKGGVDKVTNVYDFVGKVLRTKTDHAISGSTPMAITRKLTYDHAGRLLQTEHKTNNGPSVVVAKNEYNELGQLITKKLHSNDGGTSFQQHVDYRYNIRGWLTRINNSNLSPTQDPGPRDYFGMEFGYNNDIGVGGVTQQFNGNISAIKYSTNQGLGINISDPESPILEATERGYAFAYDPMNRLSNAAHRERTIGWNPTDAFHEGGLQYDLNGNIQHLNRKGKVGDVIDALDYQYNGNQLLSVVDGGNTAEGFKDGNIGSDDYLYDANGNMITDRNKDIATIAYNHLNLPSQVTKTNGEHVKYIYNAAGVKMSQQVYDASDVLVKRTDYLGEYFYENDTLKFINHEEGRVVMTGASPEYQYTLKDHLGNSRITFTTKLEADVYTATLEDDTQTEEQNTFGNYIRVTNDLLDYTDAGSVYDKVLVLNGGENGQVGLAKSFAVVPGDTIKASVYAKYTGTPGQTSDLADFATALTEAFGLVPGLPGEAATAFEALNTFGSLLASGERDDDDEAPKGFINILVFDKEYNLVDFSFQQIDAGYVQDGGTKAFYPAMTVESVIRQSGYAYVFLSNESAYEQQIGFDDYSVTHAHGAVIQQDDYYPFGLTFNSYQRENSVKNNFKFQGQEHIDDLDLGWDSFKWRNHQPEIGRFFNVDPLSEKYYYNSPYAFSENKVVAHVEIEGLESAVAAVVWSSTNYGTDLSMKEIHESTAKGTVDGIRSSAPLVIATLLTGNPEFAIPFMVGSLTGLPVTPSPQAMSSSATSQALQATKVSSTEETASGSQFVFRGDSRDPSKIFRDGFASKGDNMNLAQHAKENPTNSGFISTSTSPNVARQFADEGGFVYTIKAPSNGVNVNSTLGKSSPYPSELEIAVPSFIPSNLIQGARQVGSGGTFTGPFIKNPIQK